jgi:FKBP-type peptidyl-prolyl cis-trans isomerase
MKVAEIVKTTLAEYKSNTLGARLQKTPSNLEYVLLEMGGGAQINKGDRIPTNYYGVLKTTGEMFDNSYSRGGATPFTVGQMIPGFDEGLMLLKRGSKCIFFIPSVLGYGENAAGSIPPNSDLVFYVHVEE